MVHTLKEMKVSVSDLTLGCFISRLDRPWLDTPFKIQGFKISDAEQIAELQRYCNHVYIDIEQGVTPRFRTNRTVPVAVASDRLRKQLERLRKKIYTETNHFEDEIPRAKQAYDDLSDNLSEVMDDLHTGKSIELEAVKQSVNAMLESLFRNPNAFLWINRLKQSDQYSYRHLLGTSIWCGLFGRHLGLDRPELEQLALGGLMLDVGKVRLPKDFLVRTGPLTEEEFELVKTHVDHSLRILAKTNDIPPKVMRMVATHHERWDGSGYPMGLRGEQTPIFGRIAGLVDSFDAMTTPRPYAAPVSPHQAISELYDNRGVVFQTELVEQFIQACGVYPTGSLVQLTTGEVAVVIGLNGTRRLRPKVMVLLDKDKQQYKEFPTLDLSQMTTEIGVTQGLAPGSFGIDMDSLFL